MTDLVGPPHNTKAAKPRGLMFVVVLLYVQAVFNTGFGVLLQSELNDARDHGQEVENAGLVTFIIMLGFICAAVQLICAILIPLRVAWSRPAAIAVEAVTILVNLIGVLSGSPQLIVSVALPGLAVQFLLRREVAEWLRQR